ncbi:MAG: arylsulfatase, partial [Limisphaerales bacterium]
DDLGYGDVRCYNDQSKVPTPNLDRLARQGMRFTDAHSPATVCTPTRYSLMTGQMAFRVPRGGSVFTGIGGPSLIAPGRLTLPAMLHAKGYATAAVGKWHVGLTFFDKAGKAIPGGSVEALERVDYSRRIEGGPLDHGFDKFFGTACCPTTDWLYAFIENDRVPVPPAGKLDKSALPKHPYANDCRPGLIATNFPMEEVDLVFLKRSQQFLEEHVRKSPGKPFFLYHAAQAVHLPSFPAKQFQGKTKAGPHGDFIFELDWIVGELLATLEKLGIADNTLVIFTSDNGPETTSAIHMRADHQHDGARPWRGVKRDQWEGGHRVPFLVRWPGQVKPGTTCAQLTSLTDVMATIAAIVGGELPKDAAEDSFNMLPAFLGKDSGPVRPYLLQQAFSARLLSIRRGPWKYLDHAGSGGNSYENNPGLKPFALPETAPGAPGQLYDLATDPGETTNLYFKRPEIVTELKALLEASRISGRTRN